MIRNLKALGLAVVAVLAMSAVAASGASAAEFTSSEYPVTLTGSQTEANVFSVESAEVGERETVNCSIAEFASGALGAASESVTIVPTYEECEYNGLPATVNFTECDYVFYANGAANVDLSCPTGQQVHIGIYLDSGHSFELCSITVTPTLDTIEPGVPDPNVGANNDGRTQAKFAGVSYENSGGNVNVTANVQEEIKWHTNGALCPSPGETGTNGSYTGKVAVEGNGGEAEIDVN